MKKIIILLLSVVALLAGTYTVSASDFIPDNVRSYPNMYYEPYIYDKNDYFEFYIQGEKLFYRCGFGDIYNDFTILTDGSYRNEITKTGEEKYYTGEIDFSQENEGNYKLYVYTTNPENPEQTIVVDVFDLVLKTVNNKRVLESNISYPFYDNISSYVAFHDDVDEELLDYYTHNYIDYIDGDTYKIFSDLADEITAGLDSDVDKAFAIYKWVCHNIYYDLDAFNSGNCTPDPLKNLNERRGVCGGYAYITQYLLQLCDIPSLIAIGDSAEGVSHAWNYVYLDGKWSFIDTTWGSTNVYENQVYTAGEYNVKQFGISKQRLSIDRTCKNNTDVLYIIDNIQYNIITPSDNGDLYAIVVRADKADAKRDYNIRSKIRGVAVTQITSDAFDGIDAGKIYIPETVEKISNDAFANMRDFTLVFRGNDAKIYNRPLKECYNFEIWAHTDSQIYKKYESQGCVKNTNWYFENADYAPKALTVTIKNGLLKNQPKLYGAIYDYDGRLVKLMAIETKADTEAYTFDISDFDASNTVKLFMLDGFTPYCKTVSRRLAYSVVTDGMLESFHNYDNDTDETLVYTYKEGCHSLDVTFSKSTATEPSKDYIIIYDKNDNEIGRFTGTELAGKTINISGDTIKIRLVTDSQIRNYYGYKTESIIANKTEE